jgi:hypothetical protein
MNKAEDDFSGLKALLINCSIKKDKSKSHTQLLIDRVAHIISCQGKALTWNNSMRSNIQLPSA